MSKLKILCATLTAALIGIGSSALSEPKPSDRSYEMGHVFRYSFVKYRAGKRGEYLENLGNQYVRELEEAKRQGVILSYKIVNGEATTPQDWNVLMILELKDNAALDTFDEKMDAIADKVIGEQADKKGDDVRATIRDYLGIKTAREVVYKQ